MRKRLPIPEPVPPANQPDIIVLTNEIPPAGKVGRFVGPDYDAPENIPAYIKEPPKEPPSTASGG